MSRIPAGYLARCLLIAWLCFALAPTASNADARQDQPVVVGDAARSVILGHQVRRHAEALIDQAETAPASLLQGLDAVASDPSLSAVERDAVLHDFVRRLRDRSPGFVDAEVLAWLRAYRAQAVTPHPESAVYKIPLFNVAAATAGLSNQWQYQKARDQWREAGTAIDAGSLGIFIEAPHSPRASGYRAALIDLERDALLRMLRLIEANESLSATPLYPHLALLLGQTGAAGEWLKGAEPRQVAELLSLVERNFPDRAESLHRVALQHPDAAIRSRAMAARTVALIDAESHEKTAWAEELVEWLGDRELGDSAALQLLRLADNAEDILLESLNIDAEAGQRLERARSALHMEMTGREQQR